MPLLVKRTGLGSLLWNAVQEVGCVRLRLRALMAPTQPCLLLPTSLLSRPLPPLRWTSRWSWW